MQIVVPDEWKYLYETNATRPVVKVPSEILREVARPVEKITKRTNFMIDDMVRIMKNANGAGIAAPQIGQSLRVIIIAPEDMKPTALINPKLIRGEGEQIGQEGCLSIPGLYGDVKRFEYVEVEAFDRKGRELVYELEGMSARVVQHEIDHLEGILFTDLVIPESLIWMDPDGTDTEAE